jgi:hypothetical protein
MKDAKAITVARILVENIYCKTGNILCLISDMGSNFMSELFQNICKLLRIRRISTTAFNPRGDGAIERKFSIFQNMIRHYIQSEFNSWHRMLPFITFAYNVTVHTSTKETPFYLFYSRDASYPFHLPLPQKHTCYDIDFNYSREVSLRMSIAFALVKEQLQKSSDARAIQYNKKTKPHDLKPGDTVYLKIGNPKVGISKKIQSLYKGPYRIIATPTPQNATIRELHSKQETLYVNINRLKYCRPRPGFTTQILTPKNKEVNLENDSIVTESTKKTLAKSSETSDLNIDTQSHLNLSISGDGGHNSEPETIPSVAGSIHSNHSDDDSLTDASFHSLHEDEEEHNLPPPHPHHTRSQGPVPPHVHVLNRAI